MSLHACIETEGDQRYNHLFILFREEMIYAFKHRIYQVYTRKNTKLKILFLVLRYKFLDFLQSSIFSRCFYCIFSSFFFFRKDEFYMVKQYIMPERNIFDVARDVFPLFSSEISMLPESIEI